MGTFESALGDRLMSHLDLQVPYVRHASRARKVAAWFIIAQLRVAISSTHSHLIGDGLHLVYMNLTKRGKEPIRLDSHEWTQTLE